MIADTNFILRALDTDDLKQGAKARKVISQTRGTKKSIIVFAATIIECVYVLESSQAGYGYSREEIEQIVLALLEETAFTVEDQPQLTASVQLYCKYKIDFHDCYLAAHAQQSADTVLSFDRDMRRLKVAAEI